jgi:tRNA A37 threonylcarbamoyladenosine dehydratase
LDCIDDVNTKVLLLKECHKRGLKVVSCFGAGAKNDPTRIQIGDIGDAIKDPLASKVRWLMKQGEDPIPLKSSGDYGITAVFSCQKPVCDLLSLSDSQADNPEEYGAIENTRLRLIPVLGALPAIFGLSMASHVLCQLGKKDFVPQSTERLSRDLRNKFYQRLVKRHNGVYNSEARMMVDKSDIDTLVSEVWKERSAVTGKRMGGQCQAMALCRWDRAQPTAPDNLVLLTAKEADKCDEVRQSPLVQPPS